MLGAASRLGRTAVFIGAVLLATAPLAIIYDTYFVHEAWFCFFTWALFFATVRFLDKPTLAGAVLIGALAGLMQVTKETSVLHFAALGVALLCTCAQRRILLGGTRPPDGFHQTGKLWPDGLTALLTALFIYVLFFSSFFTRWAGVADGLRAYTHYAARAVGSAHDHPWSYFLSMLWPHSRGGVHWGEPLLLLVALIGTVAAFMPRANVTQRALAIFTLTLFFVYSIIPYKMPWLLLTPYVGLTLLAGCGAVQLANWLPAKSARLAPAALCLVLLGAGVWRNFPALGRYANDERNPFVYQPTSPDLTRLVTEIAALPAGEKIAVVSPDHAWPLPWYLRDRAATGYFSSVPADLAAYDGALLDSRLASPLPASATAYGLRPNVILWRTTR
jgi:uncharacterized protein (TIGR03663 family)